MRRIAIPCLIGLMCGAAGLAEETPLIFAGSAGNDLCVVARDSGVSMLRFDGVSQALERAPRGAGVLILADGYPSAPTEIEPEEFRTAREKDLRLYVEYPASLPGMRVEKPVRARLERGVVTSDAFRPALERLDLVVIHDCHYVPVETAPDPHLALAKVAGFDTAAYGIDDVKVHPLLFEMPGRQILVSTTKLSQFVTARYATKSALQAVWRMVFGWLRPEARAITLEWTETVRPTYSRDAVLPADAARRAVVRGIDWHSRARMLVHASWEDLYTRYREDGTVAPADPVGPRPSDELPAGDGECGVLEGVSSRIRFDGEQPLRWWFSAGFHKFLCTWPALSPASCVANARRSTPL
ncbi:MAG: hypothetical protein JXA90_09460, partial [Planctomycetes bacterium]|nr:hypothetical protein [Planctomycetota bacterium]